MWKVFSPLLLCHAYLQHQQHHPAILISSHVIMESVSHRATGVMVTMTVVTTVMKSDVMLQTVQIVQGVQVVQVYIHTCTMYSLYWWLSDTHVPVFSWLLEYYMPQDKRLCQHTTIIPWVFKRCREGLGMVLLLYAMLWDVYIALVFGTDIPTSFSILINFTLLWSSSLPPLTVGGWGPTTIPIVNISDMHSHNPWPIFILPGQVIMYI